MTRRILQAIALDKIAAVDKPCQEHAVVSIMKRAPEGDPELAKLRDMIVKDLVLLPMAHPDNDDDKSFDFHEAMQEVSECESWCAAKEEIRPLVHALKHSLISIFLDNSLNPEMRRIQISNTVQQFLEAVQFQYASVMPEIEQLVAAKRLTNLRNTLIGANFALQKARAKTFAASSKIPGQSARSPSIDNVVTGARRYADRTIKPRHLQVPKRPLVGSAGKKSGKMRKEWSDAARAAANEGKGSGPGKKPSHKLRTAAAFLLGGPIGGAISAYATHQEREKWKAAQKRLIKALRQLRKLKKQGYYVGIKHPEKGVIHHQVEAGNRRGARTKALSDHPGGTIFNLHPKGVKKQRLPGGRKEPRPGSLGLRTSGPSRGVGPDPGARLLALHGPQKHRKVELVRKVLARPTHADIAKAWTDSARLASAAARVKHAAAADEMASNHKGEAARHAKQGNAEMSYAHQRIGRQYSLAASHFRLGNVKEGFKQFTNADNAWGHPSVYMSDLRDKITKAWTDEARRAAQLAAHHAKGAVLHAASLGRVIATGRRGSPSKGLEGDLRQHAQEGVKMRALSEYDRIAASGRVLPRTKKFVPRPTHADLAKVRMGQLVLKIKKLAIMRAKLVQYKIDSMAKQLVNLSDYTDEALEKVLGPGAKAGDWIHDFVNSSDKRFVGKSKEDRIRMALGAYYSHS